MVRRLIILLLLVYPFVLMGESKLDSIRQLPDVIVEAVKSNEPVIPSRTLGGKQLESLNSHSVADAVRYFSGVQIKDYGGVGGIKTVDIRSMGSNHMGVFYDGIQLGNAQNGQIDLGKFSLDNIEAISLYNGQKSNVFQPAKDFGSAGTLYLQTRKPIFSDGKKHNVKVIFRSGSFGLVNPSILYEYKISDNVNLSLNTEYINADGKYKFRYKKVFSDGSLAWDTTATRRNGDIESIRLEAGLFGRFDMGDWNLKCYYYDSEKGIPGAIVNNVWKNSQRQWDRNFFAQGRFRRRIGNNYEFMLNAKYARDYMRYLNPDTTLMYLDNKFWQEEIYISTANKYSIKNNIDVNLSIDYQWNTLDATLTNFVYPTRHSVYAALAASYKISRLKAMASVLGTFVIDKSSIQSGVNKLATLTSRYNKVTPAVFASYRPLKSLPIDVQAFYKRIFRMPTFNDLYYTDIGNADLRPEFVDQYNIGIQYTNQLDGLINRVSLKTDVYYNYITDKIIAVPKGTGQYRWMMMNIGRVKVRGVDVNAQIDLNMMYDVKLNLNLNYTYQKSQDYSDPTDNDPIAGTYKGQIAYIPWHSGSVIAQTEWENWGLNYSFIYVGERYHNSSNIRANYEQPWYTHDMSINYRFSINNVAITTTMEINNLLNQYYDVIRNYPMPGRNYKFIIKLQI